MTTQAHYNCIAKVLWHLFNGPCRRVYDISIQIRVTSPSSSQAVIHRVQPMNEVNIPNTHLQQTVKVLLRNCTFFSRSSTRVHFSRKHVFFSREKCWWRWRWGGRLNRKVWKVNNKQHQSRESKGGIFKGSCCSVAWGTWRSWSRNSSW